jgi:hypothetical protein
MALSKLREELTDMCYARICLGGRLSVTADGSREAEIAQAEFGKVGSKVFEAQQVGKKGPMPMPLKFTKNACASNGLNKTGAGGALQFDFAGGMRGADSSRIGAMVASAPVDQITSTSTVGEESEIFAAVRRRN